MKGKITKIPKMGDDKISEMGSQVLGEMILITMVGSFLVIAVYLSQGDDLSSEDDVEEEELAEMRRRLEKLDNTFDTQQEALDKLEDNINLLLARSWSIQWRCPAWSCAGCTARLDRCGI